MCWYVHVPFPTRGQGYLFIIIIGKTIDAHHMDPHTLFSLKNDTFLGVYKTFFIS